MFVIGLQIINWALEKTKQSILFGTKCRLNKVLSTEIKYGEIHIKQYHTVTYLGCLLNETLSGQSMALKVIKKLIVDSDFYIEKQLLVSASSQIAL